MNLKPTPIEIDPCDPFRTDLLDRESEIKNLSLLVQRVNTPAVIALDSRWGTGKTTFIKLWDAYLKTEGISSLYFNAWETDFSSDPLISFLAEISEQLRNSAEISTKKNRAWNNLKAAGATLAIQNIPAAIRLAVTGALDFGPVFEREIANSAGQLAYDAIGGYAKRKDAIEHFKTSLSEFISTENQQNVIIFVDELDRCRPDYAVKLLERIKHLFNIEGLVFILALDKEQTSHSIRAIYGSGIDTDGYLRRFIDFEYKLKQPTLENYVNYLMSSLRIEKFFKERGNQRDTLEREYSDFKNSFTILASNLQLSLRESEQFIARINIAMRATSEGEKIYPSLITFLTLSRHFERDAYQRYISDDGDEAELTDYLYRILPERYRYDVKECALIEGLLIAAKVDVASNTNRKSITRHEKVININGRNAHYSIEVINAVRENSRVDLDLLVSRIEWLSTFQFID